MKPTFPYDPENEENATTRIRYGIYVALMVGGMIVLWMVNL